MHRDLKPGNILVFHTGDIKITDFGTAKIFGKSNLPITNGITTLWYSAPELLFGTKHYGPSIDI
jgi:cyclin-dependent kinase 7